MSVAVGTRVIDVQPSPTAEWYLKTRVPPASLASSNSVSGSSKQNRLHMDDLAPAAHTEAVKHITTAAELLDGTK